MRLLNFECSSVLQCINAGFEKLSVMDLLPDNSVVVCGKGSISQPSARPDTRPKFVAFNTMTGDRICNVSSEHTRMPFGMTVFTTADGCERIAFTYRYLINEVYCLPPTKLREGNVVRRVCNSISHSGGRPACPLTIMHRTSLYRDPPPSVPRHGISL